MRVRLPLLEEGQAARLCFKMDESYQNLQGDLSFEMFLEQEDWYENG